MVPPSDSGDDFVGILCPDEGLRIVVGVFEEAVDGGLEIDDRVEDAALEKIGFYVSQNPDELCEISLNLIVWSLSNYMFEQFIRNPIFSNETRIFDNIVLDAADVDLDVHPRWTNGLKYARSVYATINERDRILNVSEVVNPERLGNTTTGLVSPRVTYFDLTDGKKVIKKHQYFGNTAKANSTVEAFFKKVLHGDAGLPIQGTSYNTDKNVHELS